MADAVLDMGLSVHEKLDTQDFEEVLLVRGRVVVGVCLELALENAVVVGRSREVVRIRVEESDELETIDTLEEIAGVGSTEDGFVGAADGNPTDGDHEGLNIEVEDANDVDNDDKKGVCGAPVVVGELTSITEYTVVVAAVADEVTVTSRVSVLSGPSIVFVVTIWLVANGSVSVSMIV